MQWHAVYLVEVPGRAQACVGTADLNLLYLPNVAAGHDKVVDLNYKQNHITHADAS